MTVKWKRTDTYIASAGGKEIVEIRSKVKNEVIELICECGGGRDAQRALGQLFDVNKKGDVLNPKDEKHLPNNLSIAWMSKEKSRTALRWNEGRVAEIGIKMGGAMPIWNGIITHAFMWILYTNFPHETINKFIKGYRLILSEYAKKSWKARCEKTYDPEKEKYRAQLSSQRKQAEAY